MFQRHPASSSVSVYEEEVRQMEAELADDEERLGGYSRELTQLGGQLTDPAHGLVDFAADFGGDRVYLCWQPDENVVEFWHAGPCGLSNRIPLCHEMGSLDFPSCGDSQASD